MIEDNGIDQEIRTFDSPLAKESVKVLDLKQIQTSEG